ncbi:MAG: hypothetical protein IKT77_02285, partial [Paludibacteraceae bacterium]|nr:hypothetical protein [Paludibacteraceae bacterium]
MAEQIEKKSPSADKLKALQLAMEKIEKEHGKGTIMNMGEDNIEKACEILCSIILNPKIKNEKFDEEIFNREKETLIEKIKEERDD